MSEFEDSDEVEAFGYGEWVEFKLDEDTIGIVVGSDALGLIYDVQLAGSGLIRKFYGVTLRSLEDGDEFEPPVRGKVDNVINFTKAAALRADTKTKGAA